MGKHAGWQMRQLTDSYSGWIYASTASLLRPSQLRPSLLRLNDDTLKWKKTPRNGKRRHEMEKDATKWKKTPRNGKRDATKRKQTPRNGKRRHETEKDATKRKKAPRNGEKKKKKTIQEWKKTPRNGKRHHETENGAQLRKMATLLRENGDTKLNFPKKKNFPQKKGKKGGMEKDTTKRKMAHNCGKWRQRHHETENGAQLRKMATPLRENGDTKSS